MLKLPYERQKVEDDALPLQIVPGYLSVLADNEGQGRWKDGNLVRFAPGSGLASKVGGWADITPSNIKGVCRNTHDWQSLDRQQWSAIGTNAKLYLYNQAVLYDITPIRRTVTLNNAFSTTSGSAVVKVTDILHGAFDGDYVTFSDFSAVGGITLNGEYLISGVTINTYLVTASNNAGTTSVGGSTGTASYDLNIMPVDNSILLGWGTGTWGAGTWGTPRTNTGNQTSNLRSQIGIWSLDNWGEDLICSPRNGAIYIWKRSIGPFARAALISPNAPLRNGRVLVATQQRQIICFGTSTLDSTNLPTGPLDPSLIAWCSSEDYTTWFASFTNNAGTYRLTSGSGIVAAVKTRGGILTATTDNCNLFAPTGDANVYTAVSLGQSTAPCGPNAGCDYNGVFYMMATDNIMIYDGTLRTLPCDVWNRVFATDGSTPGLNRTQKEKVFCHVNRSFSEVWWHYPSAASNENDSYVAYNWLLQCWHYGVWSGNANGDVNRSCGHDYSDQFQTPYMLYYNPATGLSKLFQHDTGVLANGSSNFGEYIESWDVDVMQSGQMVNIHHMIPNFKVLNSAISAIVKCRKYPSNTYKVKGPYTITNTTDKVSARARGRQLALRIYGSTNSWSMGTWRTQTGEDGDR